MPEPPRDRLLRAIRVLVDHPANPDAQALLAAIETVLDEREAEVRAEAAVEARVRAAEEVRQHTWGADDLPGHPRCGRRLHHPPVTSLDRAARAG
jgi:hypothetical protein